MKINIDSAPWPYGVPGFKCGRCGIAFISDSATDFSVHDTELREDGADDEDDEVNTEPMVKIKTIRIACPSCGTSSVVSNSQPGYTVILAIPSTHGTRF